MQISQDFSRFRADCAGFHDDFSGFREKARDLIKISELCCQDIERFTVSTMIIAGSAHYIYDIRLNLPDYFRCCSGLKVKNGNLLISIELNLPRVPFIDRSRIRNYKN